MSRGVSSGGGQISLGYLFGSGETANSARGSHIQGQPANGHSQNAIVASQPIDKQIPAGIHGNLTNNYHRADGQNCGNFLTDRPFTKVHAAPGVDLHWDTSLVVLATNSSVLRMLLIST